MIIKLLALVVLHFGLVSASSPILIGKLAICVLKNI